MSDVGRFKLTDALRNSQVQQKGAKKSSSKAKSAEEKGKPETTHDLAAEQVREARESARAKNAEASIRDRMVDIGRGNQQAGRQHAK